MGTTILREIFLQMGTWGGLKVCWLDRWLSVWMLQLCGSEAQKDASSLYLLFITEKRTNGICGGWVNSSVWGEYKMSPFLNAS